MNKVKFVLFSSGILLALAFTFGCSSDDGGGISSSGGNSNGNEPSYDYCITADNICLTGPFTASNCNGQPSNSCPYGASSSSATDGDSSSSSSFVLSSSSTVQSSSSSVMLSSSSACTASDNTSTHYCSNGTMKQYGSMTDDGGLTYKTVEIGTQTWMAENLNYDVSGSKCYNNDESNCAIYGRLYDWATAMANSASSFASPSGVRGVCPSGWHLPSGNEWKKLTDFIGGTFGTDTKLKATSGWNSYNEESGEKKGNGTDNYGFSALPGGYSFSFPSGYFANVGETGDWWTATEYDTNQAYRRVIGIRYNSVLSVQFDKKDLVSVRCVQD